MTVQISLSNNHYLTLLNFAIFSRTFQYIFQVRQKETLFGQVSTILKDSWKSIGNGTRQATDDKVFVLLSLRTIFSYLDKVYCQTDIFNLTYKKIIIKVKYNASKFVEETNGCLLQNKWLIKISKNISIFQWRFG